MRESDLRKQLLKHHHYLHKLYKSKPKQKCRPKQTKKLLNEGTFYQLRTICQILNKTCNGIIPMKKESFQEICNKKLLNRLRNGIERKKSLSQKLRNRSEALSFLNSIAIIIPTLLEPLFEEDKKK